MNSCAYCIELIYERNSRIYHLSIVFSACFHSYCVHEAKIRRSKVSQLAVISSVRFCRLRSDTPDERRENLESKTSKVRSSRMRNRSFDRPTMSNVRIVDTPRGKTLVATQDIAAGTLIFNEPKPLLTLPHGMLSLPGSSTTQTPLQKATAVEMLKLRLADSSTEEKNAFAKLSNAWKGGDVGGGLNVMLLVFLTNAVKLSDEFDAVFELVSVSIDRIFSRIVLISIVVVEDESFLHSKGLLLHSRPEGTDERTLRLRCDRPQSRRRNYHLLPRPTPPLRTTSESPQGGVQLRLFLPDVLDGA